MLAIARRGVANLRAGLDRDRRGAVALEELLPRARDVLPGSPGPIGAQADREARERAIEPVGRRAHLAGRLRRRPPHPDRVVVRHEREATRSMRTHTTAGAAGGVPFVLHAIQTAHHAPPW